MRNIFKINNELKTTIMKTKPSIQVFYEDNPQFYNFSIKITNKKKFSLKGYKIEMLLKWEYDIADIVQQIWHCASGGVKITPELTGTEDIVKFTLEFVGDAETKQYDPATNSYMYVVAFGIRNKDYTTINREGSPSLLDAEGEMIPPSKKSVYEVFPNITLTTLTPQEE